MSAVNFTRKCIEYVGCGIFLLHMIKNRLRISKSTGLYIAVPPTLSYIVKLMGYWWVDNYAERSGMYKVYRISTFWLIDINVYLWQFLLCKLNELKWIKTSIKKNMNKYINSFKTDSLIMDRTVFAHYLKITSNLIPSIHPWSILSPLPKKSSSRKFLLNPILQGKLFLLQMFKPNLRLIPLMRWILQQRIREHNGRYKTKYNPRFRY